ncbi:MAG: hypothetical protein L3J43_04970 [Sulfurovum sp.]|nr:hypothetical protein [Sulfurovum sp.]
MKAETKEITLETIADLIKEESEQSFHRSHVIWKEVKEMRVELKELNEELKATREALTEGIKQTKREISEGNYSLGKDIETTCNMVVTTGNGTTEAAGILSRLIKENMEEIKRTERTIEIAMHHIPSKIAANNRSHLI